MCCFAIHLRVSDIGKEVLNSVKQSEQQQLQMEKKIVQVTPEEFLAMANGSLNNKNMFKQLKVLPVKNQVKRIVMKKNKVIPVTSVASVSNECLLLSFLIFYRQFCFSDSHRAEISYSTGRYDPVPHRHGVSDDSADRGQEDDRRVQDQAAQEGARGGTLQDAVEVVDGPQLVPVCL